MTHNFPTSYRIQTNNQQWLKTKQNKLRLKQLKATTVEAPVVSEAQANPEKFLKEFNWHNYEEGIDQVEDKKLEEFEKLVSENFVDTLR